MRENIKQCQWKYVEKRPTSKYSVYRDQGQVKYKFDVQMQPRYKLERKETHKLSQIFMSTFIRRANSGTSHIDQAFEEVVWK